MRTLVQLMQNIEYCINSNKETDQNFDCLDEKCPYARVSKAMEDVDSSVCMDCLLRDALDQLGADFEEIQSLKKNRMELGKIVLRLTEVEAD